MYELLIRLIVGASLLQLGIDLTKSPECASRECIASVERASRKVLTINWKPISVFPKEAERFK